MFLEESERHDQELLAYAIGERQLTRASARVFPFSLMSLRAQRGNLVGVLRQAQDERDCHVAMLLAMTDESGCP